MSSNNNQDDHNNNEGGVPLLIDDAHDASVSENISKNTTTNNNNNLLGANLQQQGSSSNGNFNPSASRFSGSDEFANEQMYNSYEQQALMYMKQQQGGGGANAAAGNNNYNYHQGAPVGVGNHHQFVPNNHPSVSPYETNLFVAGLPPGTDDEKLASYFTKFGKIVSARVLVDLVTHSLRNYGFVKFETRIAAEKAIEEMNEFRVTPHQILHVTWATHREDAPECDTLYVRNLPDNVTRQDLNNYFSQYGEVRELSLPRCAPFRGVCFVRYKTVDEAKKALDGTHNATPFGNRALQVRYKAPSKKIPGSGGGGNNNNHQPQGIIMNTSQQGFSIQQPQNNNNMFVTNNNQQQQFVQVIGPNGQIQLIPQSALQQQQQPIGMSGSNSANNSSTSHPLSGNNNNMFNNNNSNSRSPGSSMENFQGGQQQQQILQTLPNGQQVLVTANNNNNNNSQQQQPANFPAQGDLCFFNVSDDNELIRYLMASFGQVAVSRRTPEGALLVRLFNTQQHDFCAKTLNGKALAQGQPSLTVGLVGYQL